MTWSSFIDIIRISQGWQVIYDWEVLKEFEETHEAELFAYHHQEWYIVKIREWEWVIKSFPKEQIKHAVDFNINRFTKVWIEYDKAWLESIAIKTYPWPLSILEPNQPIPLMHEQEFSPTPPTL